MGWIYLVLAILFEVFGTSMMKLSNGFANLIPSIVMFAAYAGSFTFLTFALKTIDVSVAYAIWGAIGMVLITIIGIYCFGEACTVPKILSVIIIITGVISLKLCTN